MSGQSLSRIHEKLERLSQQFDQVERKLKRLEHLLDKLAHPPKPPAECPNCRCPVEARDG